MLGMNRKAKFVHCARANLEKNEFIEYKWQQRIIIPITFLSVPSACIQIFFKLYDVVSMCTLLDQVLKGVAHAQVVPPVADKVLLVEHGSVGAEERCRLTVGLTHVEHLQTDFFYHGQSHERCISMRKTRKIAFKMYNSFKKLLRMTDVEHVQHRLNMLLDLQSLLGLLCTPVPEIIDPVFAKTSPKRSVSMTEYERFGLVFTKTRVYKFGHCTHWLRPRNSPPPFIWAHI